jgi:ABC-2 type transport system ATP-binding protein
MELVVEGLVKRYGSQKTLDDVSFTLKGAGIYGYLGPNGAGKSTTFKILTGYLKADAGQVRLGRWKMPEDRRHIQAHIGYLPEHNPLYLDLYVREYLLFRGGLYGLRGKALRQRVEEVIMQVGLESHAHKLIGALSRGYRQRVGLAQALLHDPPLLILDEPTSGLDPNQVMEIRALIQRLGKSHTVIFSSHILAEVQAIASEVLILHRGRLVLQAPLSELNAYLGRESYLVETAERPLRWDFLPPEAGVRPRGEMLWEIVGPPHIDLRRLIYENSVRQGVPLLRLEKTQLPLEEVFQQLTMS